MPNKILINCNSGREDPERATLPLVVGAVAASADQEAVVFLTIEGVRLATKATPKVFIRTAFSHWRTLSSLL